MSASQIKKIQPVVEATSYKRQASSSKQRLTMVQGSCRMYIERYIMDNEKVSGWYVANTQLKRIADAMEEILRMVKADQEASAARQRQNDNE